RTVPLRESEPCVRNRRFTTSRQLDTAKLDTCLGTGFGDRYGVPQGQSGSVEDEGREDRQGGTLHPPARKSFSLHDKEGVHLRLRERGCGRGQSLFENERAAQGWLRSSVDRQPSEV